MVLPHIQSEWLYPPSLNLAKQVQNILAEKVETEDRLNEIKVIAGVDVSNNPYDKEGWVHASIVLMGASDLRIIDTIGLSQIQKFPYIPGYLGFRESPVLIEAIKQLNCLPDLIFVDGHGISHPRGLGIASHLGVLLDCPTIGVAKSILVGKPQSDLSEEVGAVTPLIWKDKAIGQILRTKKRCNPLIISPGHRVSMSTAVNLVLNYLRGYRLPEPTRQAHLAANKQRQCYKKD